MPALWPRRGPTWSWRTSIANSVKLSPSRSTADGGSAVFKDVDVADGESTAALADFTIEQFGSIEHLVNNAAIYGGMKIDSLLTVDWDYYRKFMSVNMDGALHVCRAVVPHMRAKGGSIVNQSSTAAWLYSNYYGLAKAGVNSLTQQLATELGWSNIRINAIAPGPYRHGGDSNRHPRQHRQGHGEANPVAAHGNAGGSRRHVPVPSLRRRRLGDRADLQRRRRPGVPVMTQSAPKASASKTRLGYIGLGNMGAPMAQRLLDWPGGLVVCDARAEALEPFTAAGASAASTPADVAAQASIISVTVLDDAQVREVVCGPHGILSTAQPGTVVAIHSTISDTTAVELADICQQRGVLLVDAPISGGAGGAAQGRLAVMIGGSDEAFEAVREPFGSWAELVVHAGDVGAGTRMKLARNLLHFVSFTATTEAARLAEAAGLDLRTLGKVVRHTDAITGGAGAIMLRDTTAPVSEDDPWFSILRHVRNLGEKDLALAIDLGDRLNLDLPLAHLALAGLGAGLGVGNDSEDRPAEPSTASTTREHA